jgi:hypothetical protein
MPASAGRRSMMPNLRLLVISAMLSSVLGLAACGGGGGYGGGYNPPSAAASKLFSADSPHMAIGSLANPNPPAGPLAVDRLIADSVYGYTSLSNNIGSLALDTVRNYLYVGNGTSMLVFHSASTANGDIFPDQSFGIGGGNTGSLFLDIVNDRLYVGDDINGVKVFNGASTANGSTAPAKTLIGFPSGIRNVVVDTVNDRLYAVGVSGVYIVNSVSTASGAVTATAILPPPGGSLTAVAVSP